MADNHKKCRNVKIRTSNRGNQNVDIKQQQGLQQARTRTRHSCIIKNGLSSFFLEPGFVFVCIVCCGGWGKGGEARRFLFLFLQISCIVLNLMRNNILRRSVSFMECKLLSKFSNKSEFLAAGEICLARVGSPLGEFSNKLILFAQTKAPWLLVHSFFLANPRGSFGGFNLICFCHPQPVSLSTSQTESAISYSWDTSGCPSGRQRRRLFKPTPSSIRNI